MRIFLGLLAVVLVLATGATETAIAAPPAGFTDQPVASIPSPTALAVTPDGRILVTTQGGTVRVVAGGQLVATPALTLPPGEICTNSERGLLGVAVDPAFTTNRYVYLYYTHRTGTGCPGNGANTPVNAAYPVNRVSRVVLGDSNTISPASEVVLLDNIPSPNGNHNAGDLQFGPDGYLYVAIGDGGCDYAGGGCGAENDAAREQHTVLGKILRIDRDGNIPPGNPWTGAGTVRCNLGGIASPGQRCQEAWAWGFRNPFRIAFDPFGASAILYANDVGQGSWEEVDVVVPGADYGWNVREGHCATNSTTNCGPPPEGMTDPILDYGHDLVPPGASGACNTITGGAVVPPGVFAGMDRAYLFADYGCGVVFSKPQGSNTFAAWATGLGDVTALRFGPRGAGTGLYYLTYSNGGQLRVIATVGAGPADANCSGQVTVDDAVAVLRAMAGLGPPGPVAPCTGDADGDGVLTLADVRAILAATVSQ